MMLLSSYYSVRFGAGDADVRELFARIRYRYSVAAHRRPTANAERAGNTRHARSAERWPLRGVLRPRRSFLSLLVPSCSEFEVCPGRGVIGNAWFRSIYHITS